MLSQQMNMDDPEAGCRVLGRCIFCFSEEQFVVQFECNRTLCERCYINRMKSSSEDYRKFVTLNEPRKPPSAQKIFRDQYRLDHAHEYKSQKEFNSAAQRAWHFNLHEMVRQGFYNKSKEMMAKYEEDLANYIAEIEEYKSRPIRCPFCSGQHAGKQYWIRKVKNVKNSSKVELHSKQHRKVSVSDSGDTSSEQTTASTDSQDFEIDRTEMRAENLKQLKLQNRVEVIVNSTCANEESPTFETTPPFIGTLPPKEEEMTDIQAYNENTPIKSPLTEPNNLQPLEKVGRNYVGTPDSVDHVKDEGGSCEVKKDLFEFISKKNFQIRSSEVVRKLDYDYKSNSRLPNSMKVTAEYEDDEFVDDYGFENLNAIHDSGIKEEVEDEKKPVGSDELYGLDVPYEEEPGFLKNDPDVEQWLQNDTGMHLAEDNDEENLEDLEKEPSVLLEQESHFKPEWQSYSSGICSSNMVDKNVAFNREEVDNRPKLMMTGRSKQNNTQMCQQYREDDFSWKPRDSTVHDKRSTLGHKRNTTTTDRYATNRKNTGLDIEYGSNWESRNGYACQNNAVDENTSDAQSPHLDGAPIIDFETVIRRAVREEEKKELVKKESPFLDYLKTKEQTLNSVSKIDRTKDKNSFFQSVLACEAIVEDDELPNLVDSSTVDFVLHGKTTGSCRAEGNSEKRNRLKRKIPNRNQEKISTPDKIRKVEKDDKDQREQFQSLLKSEEESIKTESEGRDTEDEGKNRSKLPTLSSNNGSEDNVSSSSKSELMKPVSRAMSKKKLFGNLERSAANLPSFEEESDNEQKGSNDASTESYEDLERSVGKKTTKVQSIEKVSTTMRANNDESTESYEDLERSVGKKTTKVQSIEKVSTTMRANSDESTESYEDLERSVGKKTTKVQSIEKLSTTMRANNDESTESYEDLEQSVGKKTTKVQIMEKLSTTVDEDASNGNDHVDKTAGMHTNSSGSFGNNDNDDMLDIVDEAINMVKKSTKKTRTKKKKEKLPILLNTDAELTGQKDTAERSSATLEETERSKVESLFVSNSRCEEAIENTEISLDEVSRTGTREKHEIAAAADEVIESSVQTIDKQEIEVESDTLKNSTEKQENREMNETEVKRHDVDLLKEGREKFKDSDNEKFQDRKGKLQGSKEYKSPKHQVKSPSSGKKFGKKRKGKMDELMEKDWKESLASFKKGKQKRRGQMEDQGKTLTIGQAIKLAATSRKKPVEDLNSSDSIPSGSSSDDLFKADLDHEEESESEKPTRVLRKRKAPVNVKKMTNSEDSSSETSAEDYEVKKSTRKQKNSKFRQICMSPVVKLKKMMSEPSLSSSEASLQPMEEENGSQEPEQLPSQADELLQNQTSQNCDQSLGGNSTSGTEEYDPKPPDTVQKSPVNPLVLSAGRLLRKRKSPRSDMSIDRDETTSEEPDLSQVKPSLKSPDAVQKSPVKPLLQSLGRLLRKRKSPRSDMSTDRDETTSEEPDLTKVKPSLKSPARSLKRRKPSQENAGSGTQSTSAAEKYEQPARELSEESNRENIFRKCSFTSPRKTSRKRNSPRCSKISKSSSSTENCDRASGSFDEGPSLDASTDDTLTTTSSGSLVKVDGPHDRRLSLRKKKQPVPIVIADSTTTSEEVTSLDRSADYTGAESSVHMSTSKDSDPDASYEPRESTESDKSNDTAATDEIYAEFVSPADNHPDYISIADPSSDLDFIVETSSDIVTADKDLVLVADDPDDPDFVLQTCNDTGTSSDTTTQKSDVISTSLEFEEVENKPNKPRMGKEAVTVDKNAPDTDESLIDFETIVRKAVLNVEMLKKSPMAKKSIKMPRAKRESAKSSPKSNFAIERTKKEIIEIWYESDTTTKDTLDDSIAPKNIKLVGDYGSNDSEEMEKYFHAAERRLNFPGRPYESTEQEQSKDCASTAESSKDVSKENGHSGKEISGRSSGTDVEEKRMMNSKHRYNATVGKTEEKEVNCEQTRKEKIATTTGYLKNQERQSHAVFDTSDSENYLDDLEEDESTTAFKQLLQKKQNVSMEEINEQKYIRTGSPPKADSPLRSGDNSMEMSPSGKWNLLKDLSFEEEENGLLPVKVNGEENGLVPAKGNGEENGLLPVKGNGEENGLLPVKGNGEENGLLPAKENGEENGLLPVKGNGEENGLLPAKGNGEENGLLPAKGNREENELLSAKGNEENKETEKVEIIYDQKSEDTNIKLDTNASKKPDEDASYPAVEENNEAEDVAEVPKEEIDSKTESEELDITGVTENDGIRSETESEELDITGVTETDRIRNKTEEEQSKDNANEAQDQKEDDADVIVLKHEPVDVMNNAYTCRKHGLVYQLFCEAEGCDMPLCPVCFVNDHVNHSFITLENKYEAVAQQVAEPLKEIADLKLHLGKLKQHIVLKRDDVATTLNSFKNQLQKRTKDLQRIYNPSYLRKRIKVVTEFYRPRLERRLSNFTRQLSELDDYATELRKIENPLRVLTSEEKTEKTIMALRNYSVVLKSFADVKKKVSELPECGDVAAEEIWYKFGLGQVLRDFFDDTCEHIMDVCIYYLDPVVKQNTPDSKLFQPSVGYVFTPGVDKVKKLFELCEKKNTSNERPDMKEEPVATESVKGPTLDEKTPESDTKISTFAEEVAQRERKNDSSGPEMKTGDNFI